MRKESKSLDWGGVRSEKVGVGTQLLRPYFYLSKCF